MNRKIILLLLLGHSLLAHAKLNESLSLNLDSNLGNTENTSAIISYHNDKYDNDNKTTLSSHPARTSLRLKLTDEGIDESRIGKISDKERTALLKKQKQIYQNKPSSNLIASGKTIAPSKTENVINRLKHFPWHAESTPSNPPIVEASLTKASLQPTNKLNEIKDNNYSKQTAQSEWQQTELTWQIGGQVALGLVLFYLARRIGLRYSIKAKPRVQLALDHINHQSQLSSGGILQVEENLLLPSITMEISIEKELPVINEVSLNTYQSQLSVEPVQPIVEGSEPSTSLVISPVATQPFELPYPTNLIEISPVVRSMISAIRNPASPLPSSPPSKIVEPVKLPDAVNLLADFNPKQYESAKAFLESRKALTIEQIIKWSKCVTGNQQTLPIIHKFG